MRIRKKVGLGYIIIFILSFFIINAAINEILIRSLYDNIKSSMISKYKSTYRYVNTYSQYRFVEFNTENIKYHIYNMAPSIVDEQGCDLYLYDVSNDEVYKKFLSNDGIKYEEDRFNDSLLNLKDNAWIFNMYKIDNSNLSASITFNYKYEINYVGTIILISDFSDMYLSTSKLILNIKILVIVSFIFIFLLTYFYIRKLINPIQRLKKEFNKIGEGDYSENSSKYPKDEIGELAIGYENMKKKILMQIEKLKGEKKRIEELQKYRDDFFNNVTHELKTPITTISGYSQIIKQENLIKDEFGSKAISRIVAESNRLNKMVIEILNISKNNQSIKDNDRKYIWINDLLTEIIDDLKIKAISTSIDFNNNIEKIYVRCLEEDIRTIYINLIDNAIKYSQDNRSINVNSIINKGSYFFEVVNSSNKIDDEVLKNVFDPFYCGDKNKARNIGSNGLGLYICSVIVNKYNGNIKFINKENEVMVQVILPIKLNEVDNILEI